MTQLGPDHNPQEVYFQIISRSLKVFCLDSPQELEAAKEILNETFCDMESLYKLKYGCSPSALDTSAWLLMGALNLAHRVVRLEREATLQTRETFSRLLDSIPDDVYPNGPNTDSDRLLPME